MTRDRADLSSVELSELSDGAAGATGALLQNAQTASDAHIAALRASQQQNRELIETSTAGLDKNIRKVQENVKRLKEHTSARDTRRKAHLDRHEALHDEHVQNLEAHNDRMDSLEKYHEEHGGRIDSLEKKHKYLVPAMWALGAAGLATVCGLLVWGVTKILGKKKEKEKGTRSRSHTLASDEETGDEGSDEDEPVGRRRKGGRRLHARAWQVLQT